MSFIIKGTFIDTPKIGEFRIRTGHLVIKEGKIESFTEEPPTESSLQIYDYSNKLILPGLIDIHLHAPQYGYIGTGMDMELLDWLSTYTFPEESKYKDLTYAKESYKIFVENCVKSASTRFSIFGTLHTDATIELMDQIEKSGLVAFVGKVGMDRNSPDFYTEHDAKNGVGETKRWLDLVKEKKYKNVFPIITPRFTPTCSDEYMKEMGIIAKDGDLCIQSHLSENTGEIQWVKELCPDSSCYGETYSKYGMFNNKTIMAHCVHCPENEELLLKQNQVFIAHCPTSNENLSSGICPVAKYLRENYNIGLGTDVAGGDTLDMFQVMRAAIQCSKLYWKYVNNKNKPLTIQESLYLATVGGGKFFGSNVGLFENGYEFDAIVLDESNIKSMREFNINERIERYTYLGKGMLCAKFVRGKKLI